MKLLVFLLSFLITGWGCSYRAQAALLDWTGKTWNIGSSPNESFMQNTYSLDGTAGNTVTITISHNLSYNPFAPYPAGGAATPQVGTRHAGGLNPLDQSLQLHVDFLNRGDFITVNFVFAQPITGVNFTIFDIDNAATYQDQFTFQGFLNNVQVASVVNGLGSTVQQGPNNAQGATVLNGIATAPDTYGSNPGTSTGTQAQTDDGNGSVGFAGTIDRMTLRYVAGPTGPTRPETQAISIYDITYLSAVPEMNALWAVALSCVGVAVFQWRRSRRQDGSPSSC